MITETKQGEARGISEREINYIPLSIHLSVNITRDLLIGQFDILNLETSPDSGSIVIVSFWMNRFSQYSNKPVKGGISLTDNNLSPPPEGVIKAADVYRNEEEFIRNSPWQLIPENDDSDNNNNNEDDNVLFIGNENSITEMGETEYSSFSTCMINLLKTILGAGMLAMPSAMATVGYFSGVSFIVVAALLATFGLELLLDCSVGFGRTVSFNTIAKTTFPFCSYIFDIIMATKCFGVSITYLIVIGDTLPGIVEAFGFRDDILLSRYFWITMSMILLVPLTFLKRLNSLKYTSAVGLAGVLYLSILSVYNLLYRSPEEMENPLGFASNFTWKGALQVFPVFIFAFTCHQNIYAIQKESKDSTSSFIKRLVSYSMMASTFIYLLFSIASCMNFGSKTKQNIFLNYSLNAKSMIFARIFFSLLAAFSFPLMTHPCRSALMSSFFPNHFNAVTVAILIGTFAVAMIQSDLRLMSGIIGAVAGIPICYIFPSLFYYKMNKMGIITSTSFTKLACSVGLGIFGFIAMILTLASLTIDTK